MIKKIIMLVFAVVFIAYVVPLSLVILNSNNKINEEVDYLIVLGAKVNGEYPSAALQYRLDSAYEIYIKQPNTKIVVTGGQGADEDYPEAEVMYNYLVALEVKESDIIIENESTSTFENLDNAKNIIGSDVKVGVITNNFHTLRAKMICSRIFKQECLVQGAKNPVGPQGLFSTLREPLALYKSFFLDN